GRERRLGLSERARRPVLAERALPRQSTPAARVSFPALRTSRASRARFRAGLADRRASFFSKRRSHDPACTSGDSGMPFIRKQTIPEQTVLNRPPKAGRSVRPNPKQQSKKQRTLPGLPGRVQKSAMTYFPSEKYHRRQRLNCCVRDGNRCFPLPILT